jgi:hypothetical protein
MIRIQGFDDKKFNKIYSRKNDIFLTKLAVYFSLGLHKGPPNYRRGLQPSNENIQHFKT